MGSARELTQVPLGPDEAFDLWTDLRRWPSFIDGFGHLQRADDEWPGEGSKVIWSSRPGGRGAVTERVLRSERGTELVTQVVEERMSGTQTVRFGTAEDGVTEVRVELDYTLSSGGPFTRLTDLLFIRRAQTDSLRRTLKRFAVEAAEDAALS